MRFDWLSDLSPLRAAQDVWRDGTYHEDSVFALRYRPDGAFSIACGAALLAEHVRRFRFSPDIIQRLGQATDARGRALFDESFLNFLQRLHLRVAVGMPPEGTLLLPDEPILVAHGPLAQVLLMESAFRLMIWQSTHWATAAAAKRWAKHAWKEADTPPAPAYAFEPAGWKIRARYIGGDPISETSKPDTCAEREPSDGDGLQLLWRASQPNGSPLTQIRRLFKAAQPLADVWLSAEQDRRASVSKTSLQFENAASGQVETLKFSRFQNLYQTILAKGHPVLPATRKGYLRQRTLHQLEAFHRAGLLHYPSGRLILP